MHQRCSSLASQPPFAKPTGTQLFVRLLWRFFFSSLVPMPQKRPRPASSVEEIDGREDVPGEEERVLRSGDDAERTLSDSQMLVEDWRSKVSWRSPPCAVVGRSPRWGAS